MRRRDFITLLGGAAAAWPLPAAAQQQLLPVIGYLTDGSASNNRNRETLRTFQKGLAEGGFEEGRNVAIEYRWAEADYGRLPGLATDLVQRHVVVLVSTGSGLTTLAAKAATKVIPIVFSTGVDPVQLGLVASLSRPGGNLTGATNLNTELLPKRLELLHEIVPAATRMALLVNPNNPDSARQVSSVQTAAGSLGLQLDVVRAGAQPDFAAAFETAARSGAGGLVIAGNGLFIARAAELAELALRHRLPAIFLFPEFTAAGGLMSYSSSLTDNYRIVGLYTARLLKGAKPADLPVYQTTKIELIVNMKAAKALGITVPPALLAGADEVIE
jgi:putative tryptophan/tyrosine transport system substrate-binding protein